MHLEDKFIWLIQVTISNSVTIIKLFAFDGFLPLKQIKIPTNVKSFGIEVFGHCSSLSKVLLSSSLAWLETKFLFIANR